MAEQKANHLAPLSEAWRKKASKKLSELEEPSSVDGRRRYIDWYLCRVQGSEPEEVETLRKRKVIELFELGPQVPWDWM